MNDATGLIIVGALVAFLLLGRKPKAALSPSITEAGAVTKHDVDVWAPVMPQDMLARKLGGDAKAG